MLLEEYKGQRGSEKFSRRIQQMHESILAAEDEPSWTRPAEQALREFIYSQPEAASLEISSIACRRRECEIQVLGALNDGASVSNPRIRGWQAVAMRVKGSSLGESLEVEQTLMATAGDRTVYITVLKRLPAHDAGTPP
jgi:hypothetical protein